ncbi:type IV pilin protein [Thioflexithrix psekupsensis]|uniref:Pilus assembly protein PilE n=1 Tax=Thioflexithrix psekupsensis TaxID=1570016 RepID=A0A251X883_9GAMM|nr:type IV pilin protein [Thioflexithrix psekupsensis]OUD14181.1 hypothetical protein TPSD3_07565 [Thioflexithrix psekupsensis]
MRELQQQRGFTLMELMIVVAIMAILAMIAYPMYNEQITRANRSTATGALLELTQRQEIFYADNNRYASSLSELLGSDVGDRIIKEGSSYYAGNAGSKFYELSIESENFRRNYTLTAKPYGRQAIDDTKCTALIITSTGKKAAEGEDPSACW